MWLMLFTRFVQLTFVQDADFARMRPLAWWADFEKELSRILPPASHWQQTTQLQMRV
jgi:hypothetical protein